MSKTIYHYLVNFPDTKLRNMQIIIFAIFLIFLFSANRYKMNGNLFLALFAFQMWTGAGISLIISFIKILSNRSMSPTMRQAALIGGMILIIACYISPIVLYFLANNGRQ